MANELIPGSDLDSAKAWLQQNPDWGTGALGALQQANVEPVGPAGAAPQTLGRGVLAGINMLLQQGGELAQGGLELLQGMKTGSVTPRALSALNSIGLGTGASIGGPANSLGVFGGRLGAQRLFDQGEHGVLDNLNTMRTLESQGASPQALWEQTGWVRGAEGKPRFEISDNGASLIQDTQGKPFGQQLRFNQIYNKPGFTLGQILDHPKLYEAYPELQNIPIEPIDALSPSLGYFDSAQGVMGLKSAVGPKGLLSTTLHEVQHAIQAVEGHANGSNPELFLPSHFNATVRLTQEHLADIENRITDYGEQTGKDMTGVEWTTLRKVQRDPTLVYASKQDDPDAPAYRKAWNILQQSGLAGAHKQILDQAQKLASQAQASRELYMNTAGEIEARAVQQRHALGDNNTYPWVGQPAADEQVIQFLKKGWAVPVEGNPFVTVPQGASPFSGVQK